MSEFMDADFDLCPGCPAQCATVLEEIPLRLDHEVNMKLAEVGLVGEGGQLLDSAIDTMLAGTKAGISPDVLKKSIRTQAAKDLDTQESEIMESEGTRRKLVATCSGPLIIQGSANGQQLTVTLCTSPDLYKDGDRHVPTHVDRAFEL